MKVYTKKGDGGMTSLMDGVQISKDDDRIELLGNIDELSSYIGLAKVMMEDFEKEKLSNIQQQLLWIMAGIADPSNKEYNLQEKEIEDLEKEIDKIENLFPREKKLILYGGCELSARLDVARAVTRRVERYFQKVKIQYCVDERAMQYINRLSDYLYILARYKDFKII